MQHLVFIVPGRTTEQELTNTDCRVVSINTPLAPLSFAEEALTVNLMNVFQCIKKLRAFQRKYKGGYTIRTFVENVLQPHCPEQQRTLLLSRLIWSCTHMKCLRDEK